METSYGDTLRYASSSYIALKMEKNSLNFWSAAPAKLLRISLKTGTLLLTSSGRPLDIGLRIGTQSRPVSGLLLGHFGLMIESMILESLSSIPKAECASMNLRKEGKFRRTVTLGGKCENVLKRPEIVVFTSSKVDSPRNLIKFKQLPSPPRVGGRLSSVKIRSKC